MPNKKAPSAEALGAHSTIDSPVPPLLDDETATSQDIVQS